MKTLLTKSKLYALILAFFLVVSTMPMAAQNVFADTTLGVDSDGYLLITSEDEFVEHLMSANKAYKPELSKNFRLTKDLDLSKYTKLRNIGRSGNYESNPLFKGNFDGNGHTIRNANLNEGGIFSNIDTNASVRNLTIENASVSAKSTEYPGILASKNLGTIENCRVINSNINSSQSGTGGFVGQNAGTISKSAVINTNVSAEKSMQVGGFAGFNGYAGKVGTIDQCFADANVSGKMNVGGFVGKAEKGNISNSYAIGSIKANSNEKIGGFAGILASPSQLKNVYVSADVNANSGGAVAGWKGSSFSTPGEVINGYYNSEKAKPATEMQEYGGVSGKTSAEMVSPAFLSEISGGTNGIWVQDANHNNGMPYLAAVPTPETAPVTPPKNPVKFVICNYNKDTNTFKKLKEFTVQPEKEDSVVLDLMKRARDENKFSFTSEESSWGEFVTSIDDIQAPKPDGWMFNVNDVQSPVGVSTASFDGGETILWFYGCDQNHYKAPPLAEIENPAEEFVEINSKEDLMKLSGTTDDQLLSKNYKLNKDLDLEGVKFEPIGSLEHPFTGKFYGEKHSIKSLTIEKDKDANGVGFFAAIKGSTVKDLSIENAKLKGGAVIGVLVGEAQVDAAAGKNNLIAHCKVSGAVEAKGERVIKVTDAGGLVGAAQEKTDPNTYDYATTTIFDAHADVKVTADTGANDKATSGHVGGLVGHNKGKIIDSSSKGDVLGGNTTGGLIGYNDGSVRGSKATGNVKGAFNVGGFLGGSGPYSAAKDSYSTGDVKPVEEAKAEYIGGFAGTASGKLENCVSTGTVTPGWSWNGGFAGKIDGPITGPNAAVKDCYGNCNDFNNETLKAFGSYLPNPSDTALTEAAEKMQVDKKTAEDLANDKFGANINHEETQSKLDIERVESKIVIPNPVLLDSEDVLSSSRAAVDSLTKEQQKKLNKEKLEALEKAEKTLNKIKTQPTLDFLDSTSLNSGFNVEFDGGFGKVKFEESKAEGLKLRVDSDYRYFADASGNLHPNAKVSIDIDGVEKTLVYGTDYTSEEGSTIISFAPTFLKSLKPGSYVGRIQTNAGYAEFTLAVQSKHVAIAQSLSRGATSKARLGRVNTGDSTNTMAFVIFPAATLAAIGLTLGRRKFHK